MVKGALGAGIMSSHVAYMKTGVYVAVPLTFILGIYMAYCLKTRYSTFVHVDAFGQTLNKPPGLNDDSYFQLLVQSAQILYRRTHIPSMSYPDVGEAAMACFPKRCVSKCSKCFRHLKYLAPFSLAANFVILFCIGMTFYYAISRNPTFSGMKTHDTLSSVFEFVGMLVFGMSCAGVVLPVENNMREPKKFNLAFAIGMVCIASAIYIPFLPGMVCIACAIYIPFLPGMVCIACAIYIPFLPGMVCIASAIFLVAFFGYAGFLDKCESPITVNFPMETLPKVLKGLIAFMIYITHALNFWVPFNLVFYYLQKCHSEKHIVTWELIYRAMIVVVISFVAIIFPNVNALMGFVKKIVLVKYLPHRNEKLRNAIGKPSEHLNITLQKTCVL
ncbi:Amino acid transporter [Operophtera brumata]|uniref:Amino acid transporter n=1 Tax=Operophtera brumata TaxID=104452 RepID=A0A0L7KQ16_OPEBR|nr:Amino acid transporter [Operophtera brumata]